MTKTRDAAETQAYEQGRHARTVSIARDQSPQVGNLLTHWQAGWDEEDALRESDAEQAERVAKRNADRLQAEADAAKKAVGQTKTASKPKGRAKK